MYVTKKVKALLFDRTGILTKCIFDVAEVNKKGICQKELLCLVVDIIKETSIQGIQALKRGGANRITMLTGDTESV